MKTEKAEIATNSWKELNESYVDVLGMVKDTANTVEATKKLWREGNKSRLIKIGVSIFFFPEPTPVCEALGACLIAAGTVQKGIQSRTIYLEDVTKTFKSTFKDVLAMNQTIRL
jgi:hypothetical protein